MAREAERGKSTALHQLRKCKSQNPSCLSLAVPSSPFFHRRPGMFGNWDAKVALLGLSECIVPAGYRPRSFGLAATAEGLRRLTSVGSGFLDSWLPGPGSRLGLCTGEATSR